MSNLSKDIFERYHVQLQGEWKEPALAILYDACEPLFQALLPKQQNMSWIEGKPIIAEEIRQLGLTSAQWIKFNPNSLTAWTVVHEFAHAWDYANHLRLSWRMRRFTRSWGPLPLLHDLFPQQPLFWYHPGALPPPCSKDRNFNRLEDFAEAVAAFIFPEEAKKRAAARGMGYDLYGYESFYATPRGRFIHDLIQGSA